MWRTARARRRVAAVGLVLTVALTGCSGAGQGPQVDESGRSVVRISFVPNVSLAPIVIGRTEGIFDRHDLSVETVETRGGNEHNELFVSREIDVAPIGLFPATIGWSRGVPTHALSKYSTGGNRFAVIAGADSGISTLTDLRGKRIAVEQGTDSHAALLKALDANGVAADEVELVNVAMPDQAQALEQGEVDAASPTEPTVTLITERAQRKLRIVARLGEYFEDGGVLAVADAWREADPETAERFVVAYWEAMKWVRDHPDETARVFSAEYPQLDEAEVRAALEFLEFDPRMSDVTVEDIDFLAGLLVESGEIDEKPDVPERLAPGMELQKKLTADHADLLPQEGT